MVLCQRCKGKGMVPMDGGAKGKLDIEPKNYAELIRSMDDEELAKFLTKLCVVYRNVDWIENVGDAAVEAMSKEVYDYIIVSSKLKDWLKSEIK